MQSGQGIQQWLETKYNNRRSDEKGRMNMFKKICALVLAIAMVLAMGSVAMAATDTYTGSDKTEATIVKGKTEIPLTKSIVFFNENKSGVYEPNITFSYAVEPATINDMTYTVTDDKNPAVEAYVHPGITDGVKGMNIAFSSDNYVETTAADGVEVEHTGYLTVDLTKFTKPGVYRYKITESVTNPATDTDNNAKLQAAGLTARDSSYDNTRYLDVYIHYTSEDSTTLEMYGAVIFKSITSNGQNNIIAKATEGTAATEKTTGFEPGVGGHANKKTDPNVDKYTTYDFTVKKTVSGTMADKNHEFPFYVTVSNSISGAKFTYTAAGTETFTGMTLTNGAATLSAANFSIGSDGKGSNLTLKHNDTIKLVGVPSNQTTELAVVIKEFNDTYDKYTPSADATNGDIRMTAGTAMTADTGFDTTSSFTVKTNDVADQILTIDNKLDEISPTGVVLRVAPYVLILGAGIALLLISRRRKTASEEE